MANPYAIFKTDEKVEVDGVILDYGDFRVKIARAGGSNKRFGKILSDRLKPYKRQMEMDAMDDDVARGIMIETYVDTIILEMEVKDVPNSTPETTVYTQGILDPAGEVLEYNRTNAIQFFKNLPELFRDVQSQANQVSLFRIEEQDKEIKNLLAC
jgi:hypothetical protein